MEGLSKYTFRLRNKSQSAFQGNRPADATTGNCVVCGRYMEELRKDGRCRTEECEALLKKLCEDQGLAFTDHIPPDTLEVIIVPSRIIEARRKWAADQDTHTIDLHSCKCGRGLKMPRADVCATCYRERNVAAMQDRRQEIKATRDKKKARKEKKIANKIKGLEGLKLK